MKKIVFIVEGINDWMKIKSALQLANTKCYGAILLSGTHFDRNIRNQIDYQLNKGRLVYIFTDPDLTGNITAAKISQQYPRLKRIIIDPDKAKCLYGDRWKYGVEHCEDEYIREILKQNKIWEEVKSD